MWTILMHPGVRAGLALVVLGAIVYVGFFAIKRLRTTILTSGTNGDDLAHKFEELRLEGAIDESELRKIKAVLGKTQGTRPGDVPAGFSSSSDE